MGQIQSLINALNAQASAATLTFNVNVTASSDPGFIANSFVETATFTSYGAQPVWLYSGTALVANAGGSINFAGSPYTSSLQSMIDPAFSGGYLDAQIVNYPAFTDGWIRFVSQTTTLIFHPEDNLWHYDNYYKQISVSNLTQNITDTLRGQLLDFDHLIQILQSVDTFNWSESASSRYAYDYTGFQPAPGGFSRGYSGTASLVVTPIPAALPLLAAGLGAMGYMGWRRKRKAVRA